MAVTSISQACWYNHPVVTSGSVVVGWKSKYSDTPTAYEKGGAVPYVNIVAIKQYGTDLPGTGVFGGSFKVYYANGTSVRGYINVKVVNGVATQVTFTTSALYVVFA
ncbi:MAG TPA: hypothetical protein VHO24_08715 [Opitutaceae bacterium]|nr:hypothetical protein [Opitutaceae bacterium]